jgi:hypothetical protein
MFVKTALYPCIEMSSDSRHLFHGKLVLTQCLVHGRQIRQQATTHTPRAIMTVACDSATSTGCPIYCTPFWKSPPFSSAVALGTAEDTTRPYSSIICTGCEGASLMSSHASPPCFESRTLTILRSTCTPSIHTSQTLGSPCQETEAARFWIASVLFASGTLAKASIPAKPAPCR